MAKPLHIPIEDIMALARCLKARRFGSYGDGVSGKQIKDAERIMRRLIREHLNGKWDDK